MGSLLPLLGLGVSRSGASLCPGSVCGGHENLPGATHPAPHQVPGMVGVERTVAADIPVGGSPLPPSFLWAARTRSGVGMWAGLPHQPARLRETPRRGPGRFCR